MTRAILPERIFFGQELSRGWQKQRLSLSSQASQSGKFGAFSAFKHMKHHALHYDGQRGARMRF